MTRLVGADVDLTSTGYLVVRWCGYTHFVRLSGTEADIFQALEKDRLAVQEEIQAKSQGAVNGWTKKKAAAATAK